MIRSPLARNVLSAALFVVALIGIGVQVRLIHEGVVTPQTRLVLAGYILIALYAAVSVVVRSAAGRPPK